MPWPTFVPEPGNWSLKVNYELERTEQPTVFILKGMKLPGKADDPKMHRFFKQFI